jgi:hypothetical protein
VNSISDTVESLQVATIIKRKYYDILSRGALPDQQVLIQLTPSNESDKPTLMYVPDGVTQIDWVKYFDANPNNGPSTSQFGAYSHGINTDLESADSWNTRSSTSNDISTGAHTFTVTSSTLPIEVGQGVLAQSGTNNMFGSVVSYVGTTLVILVSSTVGSGTFTSWTITNSTQMSIPGYRYVEIISVEKFLEMVNRFNPSDSNVFSYTFTEGDYDFTFYYKNDIQPKYCCVLENHYVIFDTFDASFDSTLQASKCLCYGQKVTPFELTDSFTPDIDHNDFPLLINESKALAYFELKQMPHIKAEQEIKRQWSSVQKDKSVANKPSYFDQLPSFGRTPRTGGGGAIGPYKWMRTP